MGGGAMPDAPEDKSSTIRWIVGVVIVPLLAASIGGYLATRPTDPESSPPSVTAGNTTTSAGATTTLEVSFPSEQEQVLLGHIPVPLRDQCLRDKEPYERAIAAVICAASSGASRVYYQAYETRAAMSDDYAGVLETENVNPGGGNCEQGQVGDRMYSRGIGVNGNVACYHRQDRSTWIVWTQNELLIMALAYRNDRNLRALAEWWPQAGPN
jgi:hypothetical protein